MAWSPRTRAVIRDAILADLSARHTAAGKPLDVTAGTDDYRKAEVFALMLESLEVQAQNNTNEILPDKASEAGVIRHGNVEGVTREAATKAILQVTITGTPSTSVTPGSATLLSTSGLSYTVTANADGTGTSISLDGSGNGTGYAKCQTAGADGNLAVGAVMTWSVTPTNANPTATVAAIYATAQNQETISSWALRIIQRRQERPGSGNRADWRDWVDSFDGVSGVFVYPLYHTTYGANTRGAVTIVAVGPAEGSGATNTRILSGTVITNIGGYIEGTKDKSGNTVTNGTQLRPVTIESGAYTIYAATAVDQAVTISLVMASDTPFPWTSPTSYTVTAYNTGTKVITTSADPAQVEIGDTIAVRDTGVRGLYSYGLVSAVNHGTSQITMESGFSPVSVDTTATGRIRPVPSNATTVRDAIFAHFDKLTPGDTSPASRWPIESSNYPATLYRAALVAAAISSGGGKVLNAIVSSPGSDLIPAFRQLYHLTELILAP